MIIIMMIMMTRWLQSTKLLEEPQLWVESTFLTVTHYQGLIVAIIIPVVTIADIAGHKNCYNKDCDQGCLWPMAFYVWCVIFKYYQCQYDYHNYHNYPGMQL